MEVAFFPGSLLMLSLELPKYHLRVLATREILASKRLQIKKNILLDSKITLACGANELLNGSHFSTREVTVYAGRNQLDKWQQIQS